MKQDTMRTMVMIRCGAMMLDDHRLSIVGITVFLVFLALGLGRASVIDSLYVRRTYRSQS
jgi:hypothetical protein